jgi:hypothetical protein
LIVDKLLLFSKILELVEIPFWFNYQLRFEDGYSIRDSSLLLTLKEMINEIKKRLVKKGIDEEEAEKMAKDILEKQSQ